MDTLQMKKCINLMKNCVKINFFLCFRYMDESTRIVNAGISNMLLVPLKRSGLPVSSAILVMIIMFVLPSYFYGLHEQKEKSFVADGIYITYLCSVLSFIIYRIASTSFSLYAKAISFVIGASFFGIMLLTSYNIGKNENKDQYMVSINALVLTLLLLVVLSYNFHILESVFRAVRRDSIFE